MSKFTGRLQKLIGELKRRHVTQVALGYCLVGFGLMQVADTFFPALRFPDWTVTLAAGLIIAGLPIAICLAWAFDITPQGVRVTEGSGGATTGTRARRLAVLSMVIVLVAVSGAFMVTRVSTAGHSINAVAVLPFENMSGDTSNLYFSDGCSN